MPFAQDNDDSGLYSAGLQKLNSHYTVMLTKLRKCFLLERRRHAVKISSPTRSKLFPFNFEVYLSLTKSKVLCLWALLMHFLQKAAPVGAFWTFQRFLYQCKALQGNFKYLGGKSIAQAILSVISQKQTRNLSSKCNNTFLFACHNQFLIFYNHIFTIQIPPFTC